MGDAAPRKSWWWIISVSALILILFCAGLGAIFFLLWIFIFPLRMLGDWLFISLPSGQYVPLQINQVLNQLGFALPLLFWVFVIFSLPFHWRDAYRKLPRLDKVKRCQKLSSLNRECLRLFAISTSVTLLLALPAMRSYTILASDGIHNREFYRLQEKIYPFSQLKCVERSAIRGADFYKFFFADGDSFVVVGLNPQALTLIEYKTGTSFQHWLTRCGG
ncbi:hypothetical protein [Chromobacterium vaccinii]